MLWQVAVKFQLQLTRYSLREFAYIMEIIISNANLFTVNLIIWIVDLQREIVIVLWCVSIKRGRTWA